MKDCHELYEFWKKSCLEKGKEKSYCKDLTIIANMCYRKYF